MSHFKKCIRLNDEQLRIIESKIAEPKIKRRQMILQEGFVCNHYSFVTQGLFRMYGIDDKGFEHNIGGSFKCGANFLYYWTYRSFPWSAFLKISFSVPINRLKVQTLALMIESPCLK